VRGDVLILAADLVRRRVPFVLATVVGRQPASSTQQGDTAVITADGAFHGWLGGSCTKPTVVREAMHVLEEGRPKLVALSPDPKSDRRSGVAVFPMTCHSGGSVDIYMEPVLPPRRIVVFGHSPVAQSLARLSHAMGFAVEAVDPDADSAVFPDAERIWTELEARPAEHPAVVVVATMGERDEEAILAALALEPDYLGVIASSKRFGQMRSTLLAHGASAETLDRVHSPAGLDIGARSPEEIAVSILAEIVSLRGAQEKEAPRTLPAAPPSESLDPVCGMTVVIATARHKAEVGGRAFYFCCGGCRERFLASPERYAAASAEGA
jgi:xanthine dehydrogenase accessory factor